MVAFGEYEDDGTASAMKARDYKDATDLVAHALRGEGFDASKDETDRGTPIVPVQHPPEIAGTLKACGGKSGLPNGAEECDRMVPVQQPFSIMPMNSGKDYKARPTDVAQPIMAGGPVGGNQGGDFIAFAQNQRDEVRQMEVSGALAAEPGMKQQTYVAFTAKDHGGNAVEGISPTLRAGGHTGSHANAGVMPAIAFHNWQDPDVSGGVTHPLGAKDNGLAIAFQERGRDDGRSLEHQEHVAYALTAPSGGGRAQERNIASAWGVRRLTPTECARLQGFPDDWARIPWRGKPAEECPDGPQYKAFGNSMAVPVMEWIGERIEAVRAAELNGAEE